MSIYSADLDLESTRDAGIDLRYGAMVEAQHPTEPLGAFDGARRRFDARDVPKLDRRIPYVKLRDFGTIQ